MPTFRITRQGANHYHPTSGNIKDPQLKRYGYGDTIDLPVGADADPKFNNLGLVNVGGYGAPGRDVAAEEVELGQERANPAVKPAAGDIGDGSGLPKKEDETVTDTKGKGDEAAKIEALIAELEDSSGNAEFQKARDKVIEADIFEKDSLPTKKAELLQALIDYRDGLTGGEDETETE